MDSRKYKLVKERFPFAQKITFHGETHTVYRIKALRDIPEHCVKAGDLGGYVSNGINLSHDGDCWIAYNAKVLGNVYVRDNALIAQNASVTSSVYRHAIHITDSACISGSALVSISPNYLTADSPLDFIISGDTNIFGNAKVYNVVTIAGNVDIFGYAIVNGADRITGTVDICGDAIIESGASITGLTRITDKAYVGKNTTVTDSIMSGSDFLTEGKSLIKDKLKDAPPKKKSEDELIRNFLDQMATGLPKKAVEVKKKSATPAQVEAGAPKPSKEDTSVANALNLLAEIKADIHAYESDIVKILKYPLMTDSTDPFTLDLMASLKLADRLALNPYHEDFVPAVYGLEKKFLAAEANAKKVSSTRLSEAEKKKTEKAQDLFRIAADEASSENEKELAFAQGFKQLEGIILVPEIAMDTFRVKIGLKELESL